MAPRAALFRQGAPRRAPHARNGCFAAVRLTFAQVELSDIRSHPRQFAAAAAPSQTRPPSATSAAWTTIAIASTPSGSAPYANFPKSRAYQLRLPNRGPPALVELNGVAVPFVRWGAVRASRQTPPTSQWYYAFEEDEGLGPVIDLVDVDTSAPATVSVLWRHDGKAVDASLDSGVYGTLIRSIYAHANQDTDRTNPDENSPGPAYLSQLSSVGVALEKLADPAYAVRGTPLHRPYTSLHPLCECEPTAAHPRKHNSHNCPPHVQAGFAAMVAKIPTLQLNATAEVSKMKLDNGRRNYTLALMK